MPNDQFRYFTTVTIIRRRPVYIASEGLFVSSTCAFTEHKQHVSDVVARGQVHAIFGTDKD